MGRTVRICVALAGLLLMVACGDDGGGPTNAGDTGNNGSASNNGATNDGESNDGAATCGGCAAEGLVCGDDGACLDPTTEQCALVVPPPTDDAMLLGALLPLGGFQSDAGELLQNSIVLAVEELAAGGLGGGLVVCDAARFPLNTAEVLEHLVGVVGVDVIVGPDTTPNVLAVASEYATPAGVPLLSPVARGDLGDPQGRLVVRTIGNVEVEGAAMAARVAELRSAGTVRVAVVADTTADALAIRGRLLAGLGDSGPELYVHDLMGQVAQAQREQIVQDAVAAMGGVDLAIVIASGEIAPFLDAFEDAGGGPRYLLPSTAESPAVLRKVEQRPDLLDRLEVVSVGLGDVAVYDPFAARYEARYGRLPNVPAANAYDAVWVAGYAWLAAGGRDAASGESFVAALPRLGQGERVAVGLDDLPTALRSLSDGGSIDLDGASGPLTFDPATGEVAAPLRLRTLVDLGGVLAWQDAARYDAALDGGGVWAR